MPTSKQRTVATLSTELYRRAQSIMSFTRGRIRWKTLHEIQHQRQFALNHIATVKVGICTAIWIISILTSSVMAVKNQDSKYIF